MALNHAVLAENLERLVAPLPTCHTTTSGRASEVLCMACLRADIEAYVALIRAEAMSREHRGIAGNTDDETKS